MTPKDRRRVRHYCLYKPLGTFFRFPLALNTGHLALTQRTHHNRYDARLLLDALPTVSVDTIAPPDSPCSGGWSDLPSDAEDTFFLTPSETADLHRTKRMRHLDDLRTARLRALSPLPCDDSDADPWGGSDEEVSAPPHPRSFYFIFLLRYSRTRHRRSS